MLPEKSQARRGKSQSQRRLSKGILRYLFLEEKYIILNCSVISLLKKNSLFSTEFLD